MIELARIGTSILEKQDRTRNAFGQLYFLEENNILCPTTNRIVEFGAGNGVATAALKTLAEKYSARLDAVEIDKLCAQAIVDEGILEASRVHATDGFDYLMRTTPASVDLIYAHLFGPDKDGVLFEHLLRSASKALSEQGKVVITSDSWTIGNALSVCFSNGIDYQYIPRIQQQAYTGFSGVVVDRDNAAKFAH